MAKEIEVKTIQVDEANSPLPSNVVEPKPTRTLDADRAVSQEEIESFMDSLVCDDFKRDAHSIYCDECGHPRFAHKKPVTSEQKGSNS